MIEKGSSNFDIIAGKLIKQRFEIASKRMKQGLKRLADDGLAARAFALANEADLFGTTTLKEQYLVEGYAIEGQPNEEWTVEKYKVNPTVKADVWEQKK